MPGWRAFGAAEDLDLNFESTVRAEVVTELLARCRAERRDLNVLRDEARSLTLSGRIGALAAILAPAMSSAEVAIDVRCPVDACRTQFQASIPLQWLLERSQEAERERSITVAVPGEDPVRVRRPTGNDQHAWQAQAYPDIGTAERAIVASLVADGSGSGLAASTVSAIDAALEEADLLTCFRITTACPACAHESDHAVDLERLLVQRLHGMQQQVLHEIHRLAVRYGWSEGEIATMPAWRRRTYLQFIDREDA